jgi:hypothetical protein
MTLDLFFNPIGDAGTTALAAALATNITLAWLDLHSNGIGTAGTTAHTC